MAEMHSVKSYSCKSILNGSSTQAYMYNKVTSSVSPSQLQVDEGTRFLVVS
jgi:hypothetical protein